VSICRSVLVAVETSESTFLIASPPFLDPAPPTVLIYPVFLAANYQTAIWSPSLLSFAVIFVLLTGPMDRLGPSRRCTTRSAWLAVFTLRRAVGRSFITATTPHLQVFLRRWRYLVLTFLDCFRSQTCLEQVSLISSIICLSAI